MNQELLRRTAKLNREHQRKGRANRATRILAFAIIFATVYALMMPAITINGDPICGKTEHTHTDACYEVQNVLVCEKAEEEGHTHSDECYEYIEEYVCGLEETAAHIHTDECYMKDNVLACTVPESDGHMHSDSCYGRGELICTNTEEGHVHDDSCYARILVCGQEQSAGHHHGAECYTEQSTLTCTLSTEGHTHSEACLGLVKHLKCTLPETEGHKHSEECYEDKKVAICGFEEHTHTEECYPEPSDDSADLETKEIWEASMSHVELTGDWAKDVLAIAVSQLGYTESSANFRYVGSEKKGYSRYGAWYGDTYGDWCAMFVSFCLHYAGIDSSVVPYDENCSTWVNKLASMNMFASAGSGYTFKKGDIVFFDRDDNFTPEHVGIIAAIDEVNGRITSIEGNLNNRVEPHEFDIYDGSIFGFGILPENPDQPQSEPEEVEPETEEPVENDEDEPGETDEDVPGEDDHEEDKEQEQLKNGEKLLNAAKELIGATEGIDAALFTGDIKADFVSYCVSASGLGDIIPCYENCALWANGLSQQGKLIAADSGYIPTLGDIVLLDCDLDTIADSIGIISDADSESGALVTVESDSSAQVSYHFYTLNCAEAAGYYSVDGNMPAASEKEEVKETSSVSASTEDGITVTVDGQLPENAQLVLTPIEESDLGEIMTALEIDSSLFAYDISVFDGEAQKWQPGEAGVCVSISGLAIPENTAIELADIPEEGEVVYPETEIEDNAVKFSAAALSKYIIYPFEEEAKEESISELSYDNGIICAKLTVFPELPEGTQFAVEKIDKAQDQETWETMAAPVLEILNDSEAEPEENKEENGKNSVHVYSVQLMADGQQLELDENYTLRLEATLEASAMDAQPLEAGESLLGYSLNSDKSSAAAVNEEIMNAEAFAGNVLASSDEPLYAMIPNELYSEAVEKSDETASELTASPIAASASNETQSVTVKYDGDGSLRGIALMAGDSGDLTATSHNVTPVTAPTDIAYHKQIDYLGDNSGAGDEDKDKYRLYLDAGTLEYTEGIDLLIVVDCSYSMAYYNIDGGTSSTKRAAVVSEILNGAVNSSTSDGLLSRFMTLHKNNRIAVVSFAGDSKLTGTNNIIDPFNVNSDGSSNDAAELLGWTDTTTWNGMTAVQKMIDCQSIDNGNRTNYCAGILKANNMLTSAGGSNKKMVIFLSDGVPTYYMEKKSDGKYLRGGSGSESGDNATTCTSKTISFFDNYCDLAPIYTIAIGNSTEALNYMAAQTNGTSYSTKTNDLADIFNTIIYGTSKKIYNLNISDTLSQYVDLTGNITVKQLTESGTETTIYERASIGTSEFTDTETGTECTKFASPMQSLSYDPDTKNITAILNDPTNGLAASTKYTLSFDVKTTAAAELKYAMSKSYPDAGDKNTDYDDNKTSSEKAGFYSNAEAELSYKLDGTDKSAEYPMPVVQSSGEGGGGSGFTINGYIQQHKTIDKLGDMQNNPDTTLDDSGTASSLNEIYRLYLDAGQYVNTTPVDVLLIVDRSGSMYDKTDVTYGTVTNMRRDEAVSKVINGGTVNNRNESMTSEGLISRIFKLNSKNKVAVVTFRGNQTFNTGANDTANLFSGWITEPKLAKVLATSNYGTNYNAGLKTAHDLLESVKTDGNKKLVIFLSDGIPTYASVLDSNWNFTDRKGNGQESNYSTVKGPTETEILKFQNYLKTFNSANQTDIYTIGFGSLNNTEVLDEMCTTAQKTFKTSNYTDLLNKLLQLIGTPGDFKALSVSDQLSEYVEPNGERTDIKVTITEESTVKTLYQRAACSGDFEDTTTKAGKDGNFTADNSKDSLPLLKTVSYDADTKTISMVFNPDVTLENSSKYEISFNVRTTQKAAEDYEANILAGGNGYGTTVGDKKTDYSNSTYSNSSSSEKAGFHSNTAAYATYSLGTTAYPNIPYDHPVVQTEGNSLSIEVTKAWATAVPATAKTAVTVNLYSAPKNSKTLTQVMDGTDPVVLTLNSDGNWKATKTGLKRTDTSGNEIVYYIKENVPAGFLAHYDTVVNDVTIDSQTVFAVGQVTVAATGTKSGTATVTNDVGVELPETGGYGEALITSFGIMFLAFGMLIILRKREY